MRGYSSISYASLLVPGDEAQLDIFSIPSDDFRYNYAQVKASIPLNADGLRLAVSASRGHQLDRLAGPDQHGSVRQLTGEILYPFISSRTQEVTGHFSITDWKSRERRGGVISRATACRSREPGSRLPMPGRIGSTLVSAYRAALAWVR